MDIAVHIPFYYIESRLKYINKIFQNLSSIPHNIKVFIYSNKNFDLNLIYDNLHIEIVKVRFFKSKILKSILSKKFVDPFYLTWKNRKYVKKNIDNFDVQIYLEDDLGFTNQTFDYWLKYKNICLENDYNLGFLRFEVDKQTNRIFCTDLNKEPKRVINIENKLFLLNDINPYCGFWIFDKKELKKFIVSKEWRFKFNEYGIREKSAIGWHGLNMKRYKGTVIPLKELKNNTFVIHNDCKVHHFPNNYIDHSIFCSVEFPIKLKITNNKVN